jgi:LysM repeat protein
MRPNLESTRERVRTAEPAIEPAIPAIAPAIQSERRTPRRAAARDVITLLGVPLLLAAIVTASAPGLTTYRIRHGDTLTEIAQDHHVTVGQLVQANDLPGNGHLIYAGETLRVPGKGGRGRPADASRTRTTLVSHRVGLGDTLWGIAKRYDVSQQSIVRANRLRSSTVRLGSTLRIPVRKPVAQRATKENSFAGRIYPKRVLQAAARNRAVLAQRSLPDRRTTRQMILRTANTYGVDPGLALAVAWQESGWSQRQVSVANAIGVMQVLPSTGRWISTVVGRRLDLLDTRDNIVAGVVLLKVLTGSVPLDKAVAGYYQGLGSVKRNGMSADTKRYVKNVLALKKRFDPTS